MNLEQVSTVTVYWATADGERDGHKTLHGSPVCVLRDARTYEQRLLNLGFYTAVDASKEVLTHG